ncbi:MAG: cyclase [Armatimonadetes bacterium CG07_land_8_20_14_0_80_40_9]|nr:MAG: cyclase [Armatimonadetes bacterium CG07_land_8_20_14_0_80_40_9]
MTRKFIDLSVPVEDVASEPFRPEIIHEDHQEGAKVMESIFGCSSSDLPDGLGWANDRLSLITHCGTHLDAPWHYSPRSEGKKARTIDEVPLDWCYGDGVVLDLGHKEKGSLITVNDLKEALGKINYKIKPRDIVLIMTGADKYWGGEEYFNQGCGMGREGTLWLLNQGVKVTGIDAWGYDRPFSALISEFKKTKDKSIIWAAHFVGIEKEYCHIEKLANLDRLPPFGFTFVCFPIKIKGGSAGWCRAVGIVEK